MKSAALALGVVALTAILAAAALAIPREFGRTAPAWFANAAVLAIMVNLPTRRWALVLAAQLVGNVAAALMSGDAPATALALSACNVLEVLACAAALRRWCPGALDLTRARHLTVFLLSSLGASAGAAFLASSWLKLTSGAVLISNFGLWTAADYLGLLVITPALLALAEAPRDLRERPPGAACIRSLAGVVIVTLAVFWQARYPLLFLVTPMVMIAALRGERLAAAVATIAVVAITTTLTYAGRGPVQLMAGTETERLLVLQGLLATCAFMGLSVAAVAAHRRRLRDHFAAARDEADARARQAAEAEAITGVAHWRLNCATGEVIWSDQMFRIYGLERGTRAPVATARSMVHPDDAAAGAARIQRARDAGVGWNNADLRIVRSDGELRYLSTRATIVRGPAGQPEEVIGTVLDVTEMKRREIALAESEARYRMLTEKVKDTIIRTDMKGVLTYVSPSVEQLLGYRPEELIGRKTLELAHPQDVKAMAAAVSPVLRGERAPGERVEFRVRHKSGRWVWIEVNPQLVPDEAGRPCAIVDVARSIDAHKALEAELRAAREEAEAAAAVKGEFLANMSHELRTPLTSILGFTRLVAEEPDLSERARRHIEKVEHASRALLSAVNDILDFSKLEAGQVRIVPAPVAAADVAPATLALLAPQAQAKGLRLAHVTAGELPDRVLVDPDRLRQILLNLIGNAVKFTERGSVEVRTRYDLTRGRLVIEVEDTGPGLTAEQMAGLFQRFSQVEGASTRRHGGTGLGLAICRGLAEAMGGEVGVESIPGQGSTFRLSIPAPVAEDTAAAGEGEDGGVTLPGGLRVLLADDHPANRELVRVVLAPFGVDLTETCDGAEALRAANQAPYDLILMDVRMPVMDGPSAAAAIRHGEGPNVETMILAFTADVAADGRERLMASGFDGLLLKPLTPEAMVRTLSHFAVAEGAHAA